MTKDKIKYIDLFAGCGGLSLGLHWAGLEGLFAIEKDPMAFDTLYNNFLKENAPYSHFQKWPSWLPQTPHEIENILQSPQTRTQLEKLKYKVDLIIGGPPCQGFSVGGARKGHDPRNFLVLHQLEAIKLIRPQIAIIENVEGITRPFKSNPNKFSSSMAELICSKLNNLGYDSGYVLVDSSEYGVPQKRKRILLIGIHKDICPSGFATNLLSHSLILGKKIAKESIGKQINDLTTLDEALHDLTGIKQVTCPDATRFETCLYEPATSNYAKFMRKGLPDGSTPNSHRMSKHGPKVLNLYTKAHATQKHGRLSRDFLLKNNTKTRKKILLNPNDICPTITTHPDENIHYIHPRNVTVREMARIQSFPDNFFFYGRYTLNGERRGLDVSRCAQVGNAVPPLLALGIGEAIKQILNHESRKKMLKNWTHKQDKTILIRLPRLNKNKITKQPSVL